ncbi:potassium channel family protein [Candidatus Eisenbacteria bacterium]|uniref:Potassium channel family protein n=1 Tax=Eiseniibacteriota bacterium TaxID=2212470 RepID=A0ABV6YQ48_UNCEI
MKRRLFDKLLVLFVSLLIIVVLSPFLLGDILGQTILYVMAVLACIATVYGLRLGKRAVLLTLFLGVLSAVLGVVSILSEGMLLDALSVLSSAVFYGFLIGLLIRYIVGAEEVTADILYGSICVYLLIGIVFAMIYRFVDILNPAAFSLGGGSMALSAPEPGDYTYYSFVTLTTLGYGDIQPVSGYAKTFAFLEAITGTLYVAILISRLVSLYITHSIMKKKK